MCRKNNVVDWGRWRKTDRSHTNLPSWWKQIDAITEPVKVLSSIYRAGQQVEPIITHTVKPSYELEDERETQQLMSSTQWATKLVLGWVTDERQMHCTAQRTKKGTNRLGLKKKIKKMAQNMLETKWGLHEIHRRDVVQIFRKPDCL